MPPLDECNAHKSHPEEVWSPRPVQIIAVLDAYGVEYDSLSTQVVAFESAVMFYHRRHVWVCQLLVGGCGRHAILAVARPFWTSPLRLASLARGVIREPQAKLDRRHTYP